MKKALIFLCLVASYWLPIASYASNDDCKLLPQKKAQQVIDGCWAISEEDRSSGNDSQASLKMPEQYLGYWEPMSKVLAGVGVDIKPEAMYHKNDPKKPIIREIEEYKVIHSDDEKVYLIMKSQTPIKWAKEAAKLFNTEIETGTYYGYANFLIETPSYNDDKRTLEKNVDGCGLTEKDWALPISVHRERLLSDYCETVKDSYYGGDNGGGYWYRNLDEEN